MENEEFVSEYHKEISHPSAWHAIDEKTQENLDKLILDSGVNKYDLIILARRWAYELKTREGEKRSLLNLIPESIKDILTSKVDPKTISDLPQLKSLVKKIKNPATAILDNIGKRYSDDEDKEKPRKK